MNTLGFCEKKKIKNWHVKTWRCIQGFTLNHFVENRTLGKNICTSLDIDNSFNEVF